MAKHALASALGTSAGDTGTDEPTMRGDSQWLPRFIRKRDADYEIATGFDVTCVIGTVAFDALSDESATVAAFKLIGQHDAPGIYTFPGERSLIHVIVEHEEGGTRYEVQSHQASVADSAE